MSDLDFQIVQPFMPKGVIEACDSNAKGGMVPGQGGSQSNSCYKCGESSHWARNCPKRKNNGNQRQNGQSSSEKSKPPNGVAAPSIVVCSLFSVLAAAPRLDGGHPL
jgi:hypothetical protein